MRQSGVLKRSTILLHGSVGMPLAVAGFPILIYVPPLYSSAGIGLGVAMIGLMIFLARASDVITDPLIGTLSDRWHTRFGRRKIWLALGVPVMVLGIIQLFMPEPPVSAWYLLLWTAIMYLGWTMVTLPYGAWGAELSPLYHQRSRVTAAREWYILVGLMIAAIIPAVVETMARRFQAGHTDGAFMSFLVWLVGTGDALAPGPASIMAALGWLVVGLLPLTVALVLWHLREPEPVARQQIPWQKGLRVLRNNGPLKRILLALLVVITGESFRTSLSYFFMQHVIGIEARIGLMYLIYFTVGILAIPFWLSVGRRIGKHRAFCAAVLVASVGTLGMFFLGEGDVLPFAIMFAVKGFCFGAFQFLPLAMLADIVDVDTARSGEQRTGLIFALAGMTQKLALALGIGLSLPLLQLSGFDAATPHESGHLLALRFLYVLAPVLFWFGAFWMAWNYPLTADRQARIRSWIERRHSRPGYSLPQ